ASNLRAELVDGALGAQREGVLRNHRRLAGGRLDDTFVYSITDHEWPQVKAALEASFTG
ncbi:GNAT family N-acetyltransferase, partial [Pseudomonas aeruginosa]